MTTYTSTSTSTNTDTNRITDWYKIMNPYDPYNPYTWPWDYKDYNKWEPKIFPDLIKIAENEVSAGTTETKLFSKDFYDNIDPLLDDLETYLLSMYDKEYHYVGEAANDLQALDIWDGRGTLTNSSIDAAIKYLYRYGKKDGFNKKDLMKALHYIMLALFKDHYQGKDEDES